MPSPPTKAAPTIVLYDGWCSVCSKGAAKLNKLDNNRGLLRTIDLRKENQLIEQHQLDPAQVRRVMHLITSTGEVLIAMNAVRESMRVLGRGWTITWTKLPILRWITDRLYLYFANNRHRWFAAHPCTDGSCAVPKKPKPD